jgi:hypothetical protein
MISFLSDHDNLSLLELFDMSIKIDHSELTKMKDKEVISIFNKLSFQQRNNCGLFAHYKPLSVDYRARQIVQDIENSLANYTILGDSNGHF